MKIVGTAKSEFNVEAHASFDYSGQWTNKTRAALIHMPSFQFWIGVVPIKVDSTVPVDVGYELDVHAAGLVEVKANANGQMQYGIHYTAANGLGFISDHSFEHSGGLSQISLKMGMSLQVYIRPTLVVQIDFIGGPNAGLKPFLEFQAEYDSMSACGKYGGYGHTTLHLFTHVFIPLVIRTSLPLPLSLPPPRRAS